MIGISDTEGGRHTNPWRIAGWTLAVLVLLLPLVAGAPWTVSDFVIAGALLLGVGVPFELAVRKTGDTAFRAAVGVALAAAFILVWLVGAVGVIGRAGDPANLMYGGVLAVGIIGALLVRFRPRGMARAMLATALAQAVAAGVALIAGLGSPASPPPEILVLNGFFVALWVGSALLFRRAAGGRSERGAV